MNHNYIDSLSNLKTKIEKLKNLIYFHSWVTRHTEYVKTFFLHYHKNLSNVMVGCKFP